MKGARYKVLILLIISTIVSVAEEVIADTAIMELIVLDENSVRTSKYLHGKYTTAGAIADVEGYISQVSRFL